MGMSINCFYMNVGLSSQIRNLLIYRKMTDIKHI